MRTRQTDGGTDTTKLVGVFRGSSEYGLTTLTINDVTPFHM
jgi:hypothetical protein